MEPEMVVVALVVLSVLSIAGILIVIGKLRSLPANDSFAQLTERIDSVARSLDEKLTQTRTDLAGRLQQAQGDLSLATADRLSEGFLISTRRWSSTSRRDGRSRRIRSSWRLRR